MSTVPNGKSKVPFLKVPLSVNVWTDPDILNFDTLTVQEIDDFGFMTPTEISDLVQDNPGTYWYVFGEANRYGYLTGTRWAPVFHYFVTNIMAADPTAKIIGTSLLNWDFTCIGCGGYQSGEVWFDEFINAYDDRYGNYPEVDVWAIDAYPIDWTNTPNTGAHATIVIDQLTGMRDYLDNISDYSNTPIWVTEIALHWGFDGWAFSGGKLSTVGTYHWDDMSDYLIAMLDWLDSNASTYDIDKWFFFKSYHDVSDPGDYAGIYFFNDGDEGAERNCLGDIYFNRATGGPRVACDSNGNTIPD